KGLTINTENLGVKFIDNNTELYNYVIPCNSMGDNPSYSLVISPICEEKKIYSIQLSYMDNIENVESVHLQTFHSGFDMFDNVNPEYRPSGWSGWKSCMTAKWSVLTDDLLGTVACA